MYTYRWNRYVNCDQALLDRGIILPVYVILFILSGYLFPLDAVKGESLVTNESFFSRDMIINFIEL